MTEQKPPPWKPAAESILHSVQLKAGHQKVTSIQVSFGGSTESAAPNFRENFLAHFQESAIGTVAEGAKVKILTSMDPMFHGDVFLDKINGLDV